MFGKLAHVCEVDMTINAFRKLFDFKEKRNIVIDKHFKTILKHLIEKSVNDKNYVYRK